ncbi:hypothetical protein DLAC_04491 [Tieghemostelium lacteum]|uniref:Uncharacterized protein n=1 Tax=Tieghemostelium lacteum TaxID=361077 RepID=A0A151ZJM2_TIELA|nr:hypothetical protein DLAC_04491 [Tieghemostelium lacteum]|eukprot:KYQ94198.1 hypothetical protein DLAC_04491 [Tieghemostelium lacteum]
MDEVLNNVDLRNLLKASRLHKSKVVHFTVNEKYELIGYHFASRYVSMKVYDTIERQTIPKSFSSSTEQKELNIYNRPENI